MNPTVAALALLAAVPARAELPRVVNPGSPAPDCTFHVNYDRNADLPGYQSGALCIPFMPVNQLIPEGRGPEFHIAGFSDAATCSRWPACAADPACRAAALAGPKPFISYEPHLTGRLDPGAAVDPEADLDLRTIRRPGYFAAPAGDEPVARAEGRTYTVEFTVPRDNYERRHPYRDGTSKLRGWYLEGAGIADDAPPRRRALVIMNNGGSSELTAIDDPRSIAAQADAGGRYTLNKQPDIFVFRGPHPLAAQSPDNMRLVGQRMVASATAVVLGQPAVPGAHAPAYRRDLVLSSPNFWERTAAPVKASNE